MTDAGRLVAMVLRLEAERVVAAASVGRIQGAKPADVEAIDQDLAVVLEGLERRGVTYPGHVLGSTYSLSGGEYAVLLVALMPAHAPDALERLSRALGGPDSEPRLSYALRVLAPKETDQIALRVQLKRLPLVREKLVRLHAMPDGDERLVVGQAVLELFGLPTE